jgi:hypothetical protein
MSLDFWNKPYDIVLLVCLVSLTVLLAPVRSEGLRVMSSRSFKVTVCFERRPDGGLRAYSDDVPGLVLSSMDVEGVLEDVTEALKVILSERLHSPVEVTGPLSNIREALDSDGVLAPKRFEPGPKEYVAFRQ